MSSPDRKGEDDGCPCFTECREPRGSTDVRSNAFTIEKKMVDAIIGRTGKRGPEFSDPNPPAHNPWDK